MRLSRRRGQVTHVLLTRSPLIHTHQKGKRFTVRLACVKHAASVRPEPGSNSPNKTNKTPTNPKTRANQSKASTKPRKPDQGPTQPPQQEPGKPKTNSPKKPHTTKQAMHSPPEPNDIKNMTHYRVLKQHTQPALIRTPKVRTCSGEQPRYLRILAHLMSTRSALPSITSRVVLAAESLPEGLTEGASRPAAGCTLGRFAPWASNQNTSLSVQEALKHAGGRPAPLFVVVQDALGCITGREFLASTPARRTYAPPWPRRRRPGCRRRRG